MLDRAEENIQRDCNVKEQKMLELIKSLIELDKEINKRLEDLKKIMERHGDLSLNPHENRYIA